MEGGRPVAGSVCGCAGCEHAPVSGVPLWVGYGFSRFSTTRKVNRLRAECPGWPRAAQDAPCGGPAPAVQARVGGCRGSPALGEDSGVGEPGPGAQNPPSFPPTQATSGSAVSLPRQPDEEARRC